jgi:hypothetical protein
VRYLYIAVRSMAKKDHSVPLLPLGCLLMQFGLFLDRFLCAVLFADLPHPGNDTGAGV